MSRLRSRRLGLLAALVATSFALAPARASALTADAVVFGGGTDLLTCMTGPLPATPGCVGGEVPLVGGSGAIDFVAPGGAIPLCIADTLGPCAVHIAGAYMNVVCGTMVVAGELDTTVLAAPVPIVMVFVDGIGVFAGVGGGLPPATVSGVADLQPNPPIGLACANGFSILGVMATSA